MKIPVHSILPNPDQPRKYFSQADLEKLANSIKRRGLINAIAVEDTGDGSYILVDGERRWRAHKLLGLAEIEATVMPKSNSNGAERLLRAFVANLQRSDLGPIEEANVYKKLADAGLSNNTIAYECGVSYPTVISRMRLLDLQPEVQDLVNNGSLPLDLKSTEAILSISDLEAQVKMARRLARPGVRVMTIVRACQNLNQVMTRPEEKLGIPAVDLARKKAKRKNVMKWSALQQLGRLPKWIEVQAAANRTCQDCALFDLASEQTCKDCPAVELIRSLMEAADEHE